jgi:BMFP domain-containing protein YqiC
MPDPKQLEDLAAKLSQVIPPSLKGLRHELESNFRAVLRANLERFDLVSRDRFDTQAELLARTQTRLTAMEKRLQALEQKHSAS